MSVPDLLLICYVAAIKAKEVLLMPRSAANLLDLSELTAPKRREVRDFFQFLLAKSPAVKKTVRSRTLPAAFQTPIRVDEYLKVSRNEIYDEI
jgi:hypothetical protein